MGDDEIGQLSPEARAINAASGGGSASVSDLHRALHSALGHGPAARQVEESMRKQQALHLSLNAGLSKSFSGLAEEFASWELEDDDKDYLRRSLGLPEGVDL